MHLKQGDVVEVSLGGNEHVGGVVRSTHFTGPFSANWTAEVEITEGGHPLFGRRIPFGFPKLTFAGVTG